jgi:NTE family protein
MARMTSAPLPPPDLALVLTGGGARAAYQVGLLRGLSRHFPQLRFPIVTGVSAGTINATFLAAYPGPLRKSARELERIWRRLSFEDVFRVDLPFLARNLARWAAHLVSGGSSAAPEVRGLLDASPLRATLERVAATVDGEILGIARNLERGALRALALTTLDYATGETVTWVESRSFTGWRKPLDRSATCHLTLDHILASAALPFFFPAVRLGDSWHGDGGIRLANPLSPALRLGASRILAVSPRYLPPLGEPRPRYSRAYPPIAAILSHLLAAVFLDVLDQDVERLEEINQLLACLPAASTAGDPAGRRPIEILVLRPSQDLAALADEYEERLPKAFRYLTRSLGTRETETPDFLSYLMFEPEYLARLMAIGEEDAEERLPAIRALLSGAGEPEGGGLL